MGAVSFMPAPAVPMLFSRPLHWRVLRALRAVWRVEDAPALCECQRLASECECALLFGEAR
jgi:hypothetical protein